MGSGKLQDKIPADPKRTGQHISAVRVNARRRLRGGHEAAGQGMHPQGVSDTAFCVPNWWPHELQLVDAWVGLVFKRPGT